jgi:hypothetical protein
MQVATSFSLATYSICVVPGEGKQLIFIYNIQLPIQTLLVASSMIWAEQIFAQLNLPNLGI